MLQRRLLAEGRLAAPGRVERSLPAQGTVALSRRRGRLRGDGVARTVSGVTAGGITEGCLLVWPKRAWRGEGSGVWALSWSPGMRGLGWRTPPSPGVSSWLWKKQVLGTWLEGVREVGGASGGLVRVRTPACNSLPFSVAHPQLALHSGVFWGALPPMLPKPIGAIQVPLPRAPRAPFTLTPFFWTRFDSDLILTRALPPRAPGETCPRPGGSS